MQRPKPDGDEQHQSATGALVGADQPTAPVTHHDNGDEGGAAPSLLALEDKARRLLKRCRYGDAGRCFKRVIGELELPVPAPAQPPSSTSAGSGWRTYDSSTGTITSSDMLWREIKALEGLAICLSRQLDDAGAEAAQRKALALRCREWEATETAPLPTNPTAVELGSSELPPASIPSPWKVVAAKRAAAPCLLNLASFVSNQGRHGDAEVILRTLLQTLEGNDEDISEEKRQPPVDEDDEDDGDEESIEGEFDRVGAAGYPACSPSSSSSLASTPSFADSNDGRASFDDVATRPSFGVEEEKESSDPQEVKKSPLLPSLSPSSPQVLKAGRGGLGRGGSGGSGSGEAAEPKTGRSLSMTSEAGTAAGARDRDGGDDRGVVRGRGGSGGGGSGGYAAAAVAAGAIGGAGVTGGPTTAPDGIHYPHTIAAGTAATIAVQVTVTETAASTMRRPPSSREPSSHGGPGSADRFARNGSGASSSPAAPPPSPVPPAEQRDAALAALGRRCVGVSDGGGEQGGENPVTRSRLGRDGGSSCSSSGSSSSGEDVDDDVAETEDAVGDEEGPELLAAVTRHHLAVVVCAQGRSKEAEVLLEESLRVLKTTKPLKVVSVAQVLHDLAGAVCPSDPARACALYRESLQLLEDARGVNHFLTAPTLARLGFLVGDSLAAASATPLAPAAAAGPGAVGAARAAGLAEAVCAPAGARMMASSLAGAVAEAAGPDLWDAQEAEAMIKRAVLIQGRHLGLRHPVVASSMHAMAELYRRQGRLSEAEPLFRRAISIWETSPGGQMDADAVTALHGMAHCVLAGSGADWLGRFEEAFTLVDQAYRIASSIPGNDSSSRLLLEALRMIRSRQRQGRGDPQPASASIMEGVWDGRWDPAKNGRGGGCGIGGRGDNSRCAVCLETVGGGEETDTMAAATPTAGRGGSGSEGGDSTALGGAGGRLVPKGSETSRAAAAAAAAVWTADIGKEGLRSAEKQDAGANSAYLPCGHRFHTHCIGRWLAHSSSCPSCRSRVEEDRTTGAEHSSSSSSSSSSSFASASTNANVGGGHAPSPPAEDVMALAGRVSDDSDSAGERAAVAQEARGVGAQASPGARENGEVVDVGSERTTTTTMRRGAGGGGGEEDGAASNDRGDGSSLRMIGSAAAGRRAPFR